MQLKKMRFSVKTSTLLWIASSALVILIYIYFMRTVIFDTRNYIEWQNYVGPLSNFQTKMWFQRLLYFQISPYQYGGYPSLDPSIYNKVLDLIYNSILLTGSYLLGNHISQSIIFLIVPISLFTSFYLFLREFTGENVPSTIGAFFLSANPFMLLITSYGDIFSNFRLIFLFLGLFFLQRSLNNKKTIDLNILLSTILLLSIMSFYQAFVLGLVLYLVIFAYNIFIRRRKFKKTIAIYLKKIIAIIPLLAIAAISYYLLTKIGIFSADFAPPTSNYAFYSVPIIKLLFLHGYPNNITNWMSPAFFNSALPYSVWNILQSSFIIGIIVLGIIFRNRKVGFILIWLVASLLIGSGADSPIARLNYYLFENIPGFQSLNASYYWDWILILPLLSITLALVAGEIFELNTPDQHKKSTFDSDLKIDKREILTKNQQYSQHCNVWKNRKGFVVLSFIFVILILSSITPITTTGYTNSITGIREISLPSDYKNIPQKLTSLVGQNYTGVLFLNPDNLLYYNNDLYNNIGDFISPLINQLNIRTPGLPYYAAPPLSINNFMFWLMKEFYQNKTDHLSSLLGIAGVEYIVNLENTSSGEVSGNFIPWSNGANVKSLLAEQNGISLVYSSNNYSIYRNELLSSAVSAVKGNVVLLTGSYTILNTLEDNNVNILNYSFTFPSDLNPNTWKMLLNYTSFIVTNNQSLTPLLLSLMPDYNQNVAKKINQYANNPLNSWMNSERLIYYYGKGYLVNYTFSDLETQSIVTKGNEYLNWTFVANSTSKYFVFIDAYQGLNSGLMKVSVNSKQISNITSTRLSNQTLSDFVWTKSTINATKGQNIIQIHSIRGLNSVQAVYVVPVTQYNNERVNVTNEISAHNIKLIGLNETANSTHTKNLTLTQGVEFKLNGNGYTLRNVTPEILVVRASFFNSFDINNKDAKVLSGLSAINTIIIVNNHTNQITILYLGKYFFYLSFIAPLTYITFYIAVNQSIKYFRRKNDQ